MYLENIAFFFLCLLVVFKIPSFDLTKKAKLIMIFLSTEILTIFILHLSRVKFSSKTFGVIYASIILICNLQLAVIKGDTLNYDNSLDYTYPNLTLIKYLFSYPINYYCIVIYLCFIIILSIIPNKVKKNLKE